MLDLAQSHILPLVCVGHSQVLERKTNGRLCGRKTLWAEDSVGALRGSRCVSELFEENVFNSQVTRYLVHYGQDVTQPFGVPHSFPKVQEPTRGKTLLLQNVPDFLERCHDREDTHRYGWVRRTDSMIQAFLLNSVSGTPSLCHPLPQSLVTNSQIQQCQERSLQVPQWLQPTWSHVLRLSLLPDAQYPMGYFLIAWASPVEENISPPLPLIHTYKPLHSQKKCAVSNPYCTQEISSFPCFEKH